MKGKQGRKKKGRRRGRRKEEGEHIILLRLNN